MLPRRIISRQFLRALKTRVSTPFSCKRFNRPIAISRGTLASVRFDSAPLPWRAKRKRGAQLSLGSADRTDLQRPYLNYSEKLISFFLPSPPAETLWTFPRLTWTSRSRRISEWERPSNRAAAAARAHRPSNSLDAPFCAFNYSLARKAKRNTHVRARTQARRVPYVLISFFDVLSSHVLSVVHWCVRQIEYFFTARIKFFWNVFNYLILPTLI